MTTQKTINSMLLASAATVAIMTWSTPVWAQDATTAAPAASAINEGDIVVTGIRASLQRAQDLKRGSSAVIEAVTSEDLGKFSDQSIADSLQRVPGVQIQRDDNGRSGDRLSIRGLGPQYVQVTQNGRSILSAGNNGESGLRGFNLDAIPSEVISGLTVYKTPIAENVESGLGGLLDVGTLRPLDYKPKFGGAIFGTATVRGEFDDNANIVRPRFSGVIGAKLFDDTLGIFIGGVRENRVTQTNQLDVSITRRDLTFANPGGGTTTQRLYTPDNFDVYQINNNRVRNTVTGGVQWRPTSELEILADWTYNEYSKNEGRPRLGIQAANGNPLYSGTLDPANFTIENGAVTGFRANGSIGAETIDSFENYRSKSNNGGVNAKWTRDRLTLSFDYGHSDIGFTADTVLGYARETRGQSAIYSSPGGVPSFEITQPLNGGNIAAYFFKAARRFDADRNSFRLDGTYELSDALKLQVGARYEKTDIDSRGGSFFACLPGGNVTVNFCATATPNSSNSFGVLFREQAFTPSEVDQLTSLLLPPGRTYSGLPSIGLGNLPAGNVQAFCTVANFLCGINATSGSLYNGAFPTSTANDGTNDLPFNAQGSFRIREENLAFYGSLDGRGSIGSVDVTGNLGLRAVNIKEDAQSFSQVQVVNRLGATFFSGIVPTTDSNDYWQFLPNLNLNFGLQRDLKLRVGVARTLTLPDYAALSPSGSLRRFRTTNPVDDQYDPARDIDTGSFGNTRLNPITAWNFDVTLEYYTATGGSIILSLFDKEVDNLIVTELIDGATVNGQPGTYRLTQAVNIASAYARGFEIGFNQPFVFLPGALDGLGLQANYTYVDSKTSSGDPFESTSKHNVNAVAYYEKYGLGVRLSYSYRSTFYLGNSSATLGVPFRLYQTPISNLDLNVAYQITKNFEVNGSVTNLTRSFRRDYYEQSNLTGAYYERPRQFTFGVRASF